MENVLNCEFCESGNTYVVTKDKWIKFKGKRVYVKDLQTVICRDCDYRFEPMDMHDCNLNKLRDAYNESV